MPKRDGFSHHRSLSVVNLSYTRHFHHLLSPLLCSPPPEPQEPLSLALTIVS